MALSSSSVSFGFRQTCHSFRACLGLLTSEKKTDSLTDFKPDRPIVFSQYMT